jgi:hypothetical protein
MVAIRRFAAAAMLALTAPAYAQGVQVSGLSDVGFGTIGNFGSDLIRSQSICAFSGLLGGRYSVTAFGSGAGGAFTLSNGAAALPYEVQWNTSAGQTTGTGLTANVPLAGQTMLLSCPVLQTTNTSLIVILRAAQLHVATAGNYSGTLTVILAAN